MLLYPLCLVNFLYFLKTVILIKVLIPITDILGNYFSSWNYLYKNTTSFFYLNYLKLLDVKPRLLTEKFSVINYINKYKQENKKICLQKAGVLPAISSI